MDLSCDSTLAPILIWFRRLIEIRNSGEPRSAEWSHSELLAQEREG